MSSILDALKKLEKEKIHRDEVSTAIASDILRSGGKRKPPQWILPLVLFLLAFIAGGLALVLFRELKPLPVGQANTVQSVEVSKSNPPKPDLIPDAETLVVTEPADLPILSGIVYQQQKEARMAILNDLPVMEGTVIAGYTLHKISPDRVILTRQGHAFTILVDPNQ